MSWTIHVFTLASAAQLARGLTYFSGQRDQGVFADGLVGDGHVLSVECPDDARSIDDVFAGVRRIDPLALATYRFAPDSLGLGA